MKPQVLLLTCDTNVAAHPFDRTRPAMEALLGPQVDLTVLTNLESIKAGEDLDSFAAIVLHGLYNPRDEVIEHALEDYVCRGKGLVVIHIASNSFEGSPRFRRLLGRVWEYGYEKPPFTSDHPPRGAFQVDILDSAHPITVGLNPFVLADDERYQNLVVAPDAAIQVLATATIDGRTEPVAWVLTQGSWASVLSIRGRVFHITLGHDLSTYENTFFREIVLRGLSWAAGETREPERVLGEQ